MSFFFFNDTATTEIYTLSLHDALPICAAGRRRGATRSTRPSPLPARPRVCRRRSSSRGTRRSEEHTSELQSQSNLVCRLLLAKKKTYSPRFAARGVTCTCIAYLLLHSH